MALEGFARGLWMLGTLGLAAGVASAGPIGSTPGEQNNGSGLGSGGNAPDRIVLTGIVRDFRADHPDFQRLSRNAAGSAAGGLYARMVHDQLDAEGKPAFRSKGYRVTSAWRDAQGRAIMPFAQDKSYYDLRPDDTLGSTEPLGDAVTGEHTFRQWYRDVPGVNMSKPVSITLNRDPNSGNYVFDDRTDPVYSQLGGFFPINGELYGDYENGRNYHFTYELHMNFTYRAGSGQTFTFDGDDDVWVFIDGKLVIDLGGLHNRMTQTVEIDRLNWLEDGKRYDLRFFFAERHTADSNFRIETNIDLRSAPLPVTSGLFD